jgi:hypothetical protein
MEYPTSPCLPSLLTILAVTGRSAEDEVHRTYPGRYTRGRGWRRRSFPRSAEPTPRLDMDRRLQEFDHCAFDDP